MRVEMRIDGIVFQIDTRNPRLLAEWLVEKFADIYWTPATDCRLLAFPSWTAGDGPGGMNWAKPQADWITDSRFLGVPIPVKSPQEFADALQSELNKVPA